MSKIKDPTILFQYKTAPQLSSLLAGSKQFVIDNSKEDIFRFFNIDEAVGLWLDQLGAYLNVERPLIAALNSGYGTFIMDSSLMDGSDLLDGTAFATDDLYRAFIKGQILKRNSRFTVDDIISVLQFTFPESIILITEGIKCLNINVGVTNNQDKINLELLNGLDPKWFGTPSGVCIESFNTFVLPVGTSFFITDSSKMDNPNSLMI